MNTEKMIYIKKRQTRLAIKLENILYLEKFKRQIIVHITEGEDICVYGKFDALIPMLDGRFAHPHQSYIINMQHVIRLGSNEVVMLGGMRIRLGNHCFAKLKKAYDEYIKDSISITKYSDRIGC
jgi:DNA-binding LytR/AlgR family response regulator